eukprot:CAMPEP_0172898278 /NCGR_PEP_ID=MMETSP1075-20121228/159363_1 /TAXON_ID=2916 /ORGANISM="Ceratium fusus, Strain PA161109" /LENGTH=48 /DNA_ID= /DNA_START= /DNA_END= /DNA_ORIENTATION=
MPRIPQHWHVVNLCPAAKLGNGAVAGPALWRRRSVETVGRPAAAAAAA